MTRADFNHLLNTIKALPPEQMRQLRQQLDQMPEPPAKPKQPPARTSAKASKRAKPAQAEPRKPMTEEEFKQHLLSIGLITSLPDPSLDIDDDDPDDQPIAIEGEPLSETIIRERR